jgi:PST family polysaccharide transporter
MVTGLAMDVLMGVGATRWTLWLNLGWALALIPVLWFATRLDGIRGAAIAQVAVGIVVAIPLAAVALHRAGVRLAPMGPPLVRPLLAAGVAGVAAVAVARVSGPYPIVQLAVAGTVGLAVYVPFAVPRAQLREWLRALRPTQPARALD